MTSHPALAFALELADKILKLVAVLLAGLWTYWNYRKSRTYEQKLELRLASSLYRRGEFVEITAGVKNLGLTKHMVQQEGTTCEIITIFDDLSEETIHAFRVFTQDAFIEPGETISDVLLFRFAVSLPRLVWIRVDLRVASGGVEWHQSELVRVDSHSAESND